MCDGLTFAPAPLQTIHTNVWCQRPRRLASWLVAGPSLVLTSGKGAVEAFVTRGRAGKSISALFHSVRDNRGEASERGRLTKTKQRGGSHETQDASRRHDRRSRIGAELGR